MKMCNYVRFGLVSQLVWHIRASPSSKAYMQYCTCRLRLCSPPHEIINSLQGEIFWSRTLNVNQSFNNQSLLYLLVKRFVFQEIYMPSSEIFSYLFVFLQENRVILRQINVHLILFWGQFDSRFFLSVSELIYSLFLLLYMLLLRLPFPQILQQILYIEARLSPSDSEACSCVLSVLVRSQLLQETAHSLPPLTEIGTISCPFPTLYFLLLSYLNDST